MNRTNLCLTTFSGTNRTIIDLHQASVEADLAWAWLTDVSQLSVSCDSLHDSLVTAYMSVVAVITWASPGPGAQTSHITSSGPGNLKTMS